MRKNIQAALDEFFAHLEQRAQLAREVSERAFFGARAKLTATAISSLNAWLVQQADVYGFVPRWHGPRLVAADASTLKFGHRASHVPRAASTEQITFGLYLPGAEMMLAASLHSIHENERQMLFQHLDLLTCDDVRLMDRGYPCRWLVALLNHRGIGFCMRVEKAGNSGFACVRDFLRSGKNKSSRFQRRPKPTPRPMIVPLHRKSCVSCDISLPMGRCAFSWPTCSQSLAEAARKNEINDAIKKIKELMLVHGVTVNDLSSAGGTKAAKAKSTVAAQFKNPETGETWTGRGRAPRWLDGKDKEQFRINN